MTRPPLLPLDDALAQLLAQAAPLAQGVVALVAHLFEDRGRTGQPPAAVAARAGARVASAGGQCVGWPS